MVIVTTLALVAKAKKGFLLTSFTFDRVEDALYLKTEPNKT